MTAPLEIGLGDDATAVPTLPDSLQCSADRVEPIAPIRTTTTRRAP